MLTRVTEVGVALGHGGGVAVIAGVSAARVVVVDLASSVGSPHESGAEAVLSSVLLATAARLGRVGRDTAVQSGHLAALGKLETVFKEGRVAQDDLLRRRSVDAVVRAFSVERETLTGGELDGVGGEVADESRASVGGVTGCR